jgi:NAD(P)H-nitrite reductase large subunit
VGGVLQKLSEKNGVKVVTSARINSVEGDENAHTINLDGATLASDVLIVATGVEASTPFASNL